MNQKTFQPGFDKFVEGVFRLPNIRYTTFLEDELVAVVRTGRAVFGSNNPSESYARLLALGRKYEKEVIKNEI